MTVSFCASTCALLLLTAPAARRDAPRGLRQQIAAVKAELIRRHGAAQKERIERGVDQVAARWRASDGDLAEFALRHFIADPAQLEQTFNRLEATFEHLDGHFHEIRRELGRPTDVDTGPMLAVDPLLGALDAGAHLTEDLFTSKVGFVVLLNFPLTTLKERLERGQGFSRLEWAQTRLAGRFATRLPAAVVQEQSEAGARADLYIAQYNLWMHHLLDEQGERLFPRGMRLISHWNLRDEIKADYADPRGLAKQRMILQVMSRIVTQTIPAAVVDNPRLDWNPFTNAVTPAPASEVEDHAPERAARPDGARESDTRYAHLLAQFHARRKADPYSPAAPTELARSFELQREIPEEQVVALLTQVLTSPLVPRVAAEIEKRLGRKLEPQDLWYHGFAARGQYPEAELDALTRKRYPTAEAFTADLPALLEKLGFTPEKARFAASHIKVDPSRGPGHAMPAMRRGDFPRLRTRVGPGGMDYKGYNIAVHELGHNVEQVFSLYGVDHTLLQGVPSSAFTEALAFVFQARDLELLGLARPDPELERRRVLHDFWQTWEIAGVALVDIAVWHWMYAHPRAPPAELREAVVRIARDHWNRFYAPMLGGKDAVILGIYSHMINYPLYLCDYPLGHLIAFQIEEHLAGKQGHLGAEFERMTTLGAVAPDLWMRNATSAPVSAEPLLAATARALGVP